MKSKMWTPPQSRWKRFEVVMKSNRESMYVSGSEKRSDRGKGWFGGILWPLHESLGDKIGEDEDFLSRRYLSLYL